MLFNSLVAFNRAWCPWWGNKKRGHAWHSTALRHFRKQDAGTYSTNSVSAFISFYVVHAAYFVILKIAWNKASSFSRLCFCMCGSAMTCKHANQASAQGRDIYLYLYILFFFFFCNSNTDAFRGLNLRQSIGAVDITARQGNPPNI